MQALKNIFFGILIGLIASAAILFVASPRSGSAVTLLPSSTPSPLTIQISGAITNPGLFTLSPGSRVIDAIEMAGGHLPTADLSSINLAQKLVDGMHLYIPDISDADLPQKQTNPTNGVIDLNTATLDQLDQLPGIGLTKAEAILAYRQKIGGFDTIDQILDVPGIGPALFDQIKDRISVTP